MAARLSFDERCVISAMVGVGASRQIADESTRRRCGGRSTVREADRAEMLRQRPRWARRPKVAGRRSWPKSGWRWDGLPTP